MAKFQKGQSGNPAGRPAGVPNKATGRARELLAEFTADKLQQLDQLWDELPPDKKVELLAKLLPYTAPKLGAQQITIDAPDVAATLPRWMEDS